MMSQEYIIDAEQADLVPLNLNCPICMAEDPIKPVVLTCGHLFCLECEAKDYKRQNPENLDPDKKAIYCALCRDRYFRSELYLPRPREAPEVIDLSLSPEEKAQISAGPVLETTVPEAPLPEASDTSAPVSSAQLSAEPDSPHLVRVAVSVDRILSHIGRGRHIKYQVIFTDGSFGTMSKEALEGTEAFQVYSRAIRAANQRRYMANKSV